MILRHASRARYAANGDATDEPIREEGIVQSMVGRPIGVSVAAVAIAALLCAGASSASASTGEVESGHAALSDAVSSYVQGDTTAALGLVQVASELASPNDVDVVAIDETDDSEALARGAGSSLLVDGSGSVSVASPYGDEIGLANLDGAVTVVDGAIVVPDAAPSTDVVTRATQSGVQMTAILADEHAPTDIDFGLSMPDGAELSVEEDGSIAVSALVETSTYDAAEFERTSSQIESILGDITDTEEITDEQWAQIEAVPTPRETVAVSVERIATIEEPWAVDANGTALPTHYEITSDGITQVVETDANTAFPVIADPTGSGGSAPH